MSRLSALVETVTAGLRRARAAAVGHRYRRADSRSRAICPVDSRAFTPLYSDGHCPLCGWVPEGYEHRLPGLARYDRYWGAIAAIAATSLVMCLLVVSAYTHG